MENFELLEKNIEIAYAQVKFISSFYNDETTTYSNLLRGIKILESLLINQEKLLNTLEMNSNKVKKIIYLWEILNHKIEEIVKMEERYTNYVNISSKIKYLCDKIALLINEKNRKLNYYYN